MAQKLPKRSPRAPATTAAARAQSDAAEALGILHPERSIAIGDRVLQVREYGYIEGLKLQSAAKPFLDDLYQAFLRSDEPPSADEIADIMATHIVTVQWMIAQAITPDHQDDPQKFVADVAGNATWINGLDEGAGDLLTAVWWEVNKRFFTRRLQRRALAAGTAARRESLSASSASTTP